MFARLLWIIAGFFILAVLLGGYVSQNPDYATDPPHKYVQLAALLTPWAYGGLGACAFLLRSAHEHIYKRSFDVRRKPEYLNRILLGAISGGAVIVLINQLTDQGGAAINLSSPTVDVSLPASVDAGSASVDTGVVVNTNGPGVDIAASATADAAPVGQGADAAVGVGIATGPAPIADLGIETEVGTSSGHGRFTVVVGASNDQQEVTVGSVNAAEAGSNSGPGNGNHGVDVTIDLGVDLGHEDDSATAPSTDTTGTDKPGHNPPADVVDLLDGLLRRRGKK